jgi:hypothetical protein
MGSDDRIVELGISKSDINELKPWLFEKVEASCDIKFDFSKRNVAGKIPCKLGKIKKGGAASVSVAEGMVNLHTHPQDCYGKKHGEDTLWGWPSGDDMRECIRFMFKGNVCHLVFALEGIYTIQVNPCVLYFLKNRVGEIAMKNPERDSDFVRGLFISLVETFFKATHGHRCRDYNIEMEKNGNSIVCPNDWVDFANNFRLGNLVNKHGNVCTKELPCNGVPVENALAVKIGDYNKYYKYEHWNYDEEGQPENSKRDFCPKDFDALVKKMDNLKSVSYGNEKWKKGQIFNVKFYPNCFDYGNGFKSFKTFLRHMRSESKMTGKFLSNIIADYMQSNKTVNVGSITFNDTPKITFRPLVDSNGKFGFVTGKNLHDVLTR